MKVLPNPQSVSDYLSACDQGAVRVNREYQRSGNIWSRAAKSFLIETVVLDYPMPALYLHTRFDKESRRPFRDIVDGQQRTEALMDFYHNKLRLSKALERPSLRGRKFTELEADDYQSFMSYSMPLFHLENATDADVREAFRRINSYNADLNAEEKRHSRFQGPFKLFAQYLSRELQEPLIRWGVFSTSDVNRMKDAWLVSEIIFACENGLQTTKAQHLDSLYAQHEKEEAKTENEDRARERAQFRERILRAFHTIAEWDWLHNTALAKGYQFMLIVLAVMHAREAIRSLNPVVSGGTGVDPNPTEFARLIRAVENTDLVIEASGIDVNDEEAAEEYLEYLTLVDLVEFVVRSSKSTNTRESREIRFRTFYRAVAG